MPDLPGITGVPQAQFDKIVACFPGATLAEKADAYKAWQINRVLDYVEEVEQRRAQVAIHASLPQRPVDPTLAFREAIK